MLLGRTRFTRVLVEFFLASLKNTALFVWLDVGRSELLFSHLTFGGDELNTNLLKDHARRALARI